MNEHQRKMARKTGASSDYAGGGSVGRSVGRFGPMGPAPAAPRLPAAPASQAPGPYRAPLASPPAPALRQAQIGRAIRNLPPFSPGFRADGGLVDRVSRSAESAAEKEVNRQFRTRSGPILETGGKALPLMEVAKKKEALNKSKIDAAERKALNMKHGGKVR